MSEVGNLTTREDLLNALEGMARQHCNTNLVGLCGGKTEPNITDSEALTDNACALRMLAESGRFRIVREYGRMVVGYWPEHDPEGGRGNE